MNNEVQDVHTVAVQGAILRLARGNCSKCDKPANLAWVDERWLCLSCNAAWIKGLITGG